MSLTPPPGRGDYRFDLTRWNRAGLTRMHYVDANAAVILEELRIGMLAGYLRGAPAEERTPEAWRDLFTKPPAERGLARPYARYAEDVAWADLLPPLPAKTETEGHRNARLVDQYARRSPDYAWEIMRAFARAAHVLTGHLDAYANEGYLRTATQWDNLRKLAGMVNYLPTPPASATATVALEMVAGAGLVEVARGLAMKYAPPEGGAPLIFETLKPRKAHPDLNAARASQWNTNPTTLNAPASTDWVLPKKAKLAVGDVVALVAKVSGSETGLGRTLETVERSEDGTQVSLTLEPTSGLGASYAATTIRFAPKDVRTGLAISESGIGKLVLKFTGAGSIPPNSIVELRPTAGGATVRAVVAEAEGDRLIVQSDADLSGELRVEVYTPVAAQSDCDFLAPKNRSTLYFAKADGTVISQSGTLDPEDEDDKVARRFERPSGATGSGYLNLGANRVSTGKVIAQPAWHDPAKGTAIRFAGAPPEGLAQGDWYVARALGSATPMALQVNSVRIEAKEHVIVFSDPPPADPEETEFFGPMTEEMRPLHHDRNPRDAVVDGAVELIGLAPEARDLIRPGKTCIVLRERDDTREAATAEVVETRQIGSARLRVHLLSDQDFAGWEKGWTRFHFNAVTISHGETQAPKILGSGLAEKERQEFRFKADTVSFIPSTASVTGVVPDMDVAVDGVKWEYRDLGDPDAEGRDAWSVRLNDDDSLQVHLRRRLPSGTDNVTVPRHRLGSGLKGSRIPAWSFTKPMKKNRFVEAVLQPFATAGGADREPVSALRENAPAHLAANGRAVSLRDFGRLCQRHAAVAQARARQVIGTGGAPLAEVIVVPAGGGAVAPSLRDDLSDYLRARAMPGANLRIVGYADLFVEIAVRVLVDTARYEKSDVQDAALAELRASFSLDRRALGQPLCVAEILAAAERVEGVGSVLIETFVTKPGSPAPLRSASLGGALSAIFPREEQLVHAAPADIAVITEALA